MDADAAIDGVEEGCDGLIVFGENAIGVVGAEAVDVSDGFGDVVYRCDADFRVEIFGAPIFGGGFTDAGIEGLGHFITDDFAAIIEELCEDGFCDFGGEILVEQEGFRRAADSCAAEFGVMRNLDRNIGFDGGVDIDVADAVEVAEDRHAGFVLHAFDEAFAAARDDRIDEGGA